MTFLNQVVNEEGEDKHTEKKDKAANHRMMRDFITAFQDEYSSSNEVMH